MNRNCLTPEDLAQSATGLRTINYNNNYRKQRSISFAEKQHSTYFTASKSLPLLSNTASNAAEPTAFPTSAESPHTVRPPALTNSCKANSGAGE